MAETDAPGGTSAELASELAAFPDLNRISEPELLHFVESAIDRLSIESLLRIGDTVRTKRQAKQEESRLTARQKIEHELQTTGLSLRDLFPELLPTGSRKRTDGAAIPPKFRGPNGETWTGRGRLPNWLAALELADRKRDEFRIPEEAGDPPPG
jgi:DNA-binding protein H-NS